MSFKDWLKQMKEEVEEAIDKQETKMNPTQEKFLPMVAMYQQEKLLKQNKSLIWATWILAIFTIILALVTYFKS